MTGDKRTVLTAMTLVALGATLVSTASLYGEEPRALFVGMVALDGFALFFKLLIATATIGEVIFGLQSPDIDSKRLA